MGNYCNMDYNPKEIGNILKVIKDNGYASAQDIRQFLERGIPILRYLVEYYNKIRDIEISMSELYGIIRDKEVSYKDVINAFKDNGVYYVFKKVDSDNIDDLIIGWVICGICINLSTHLICDFCSDDDARKLVDKQAKKIGGNIKSITFSDVLYINSTFLPTPIYGSDMWRIENWMKEKGYMKI